MTDRQTRTATTLAAILFGTALEAIFPGKALAWMAGIYGVTIVIFLLTAPFRPVE